MLTKTTWFLSVFGPWIGWRSISNRCWLVLLAGVSLVRLDVDVFVARNVNQNVGVVVFRLVRRPRPPLDGSKLASRRTGDFTRRRRSWADWLLTRSPGMMIDFTQLRIRRRRRLHAHSRRSISCNRMANRNHYVGPIKARNQMKSRAIC